MKKLLLIGGGLFIVLAITVVLLGQQFLSKTVSQKAIAYLEEVTGSSVGVKGASMAIFPSPKVVLEGFTLQNPEGFLPDPAFKVGRLHLKLNGLTMLTKKFMVKRCMVEDVEVLYEVNEQGRSNIAQLFYNEFGEPDTTVDTTSYESYDDSDSTDVYAPDTTVTIIDDTPRESEPFFEAFRDVVLVVENVGVEDCKVRYINRQSGASCILEDIDYHFNFAVNGPKDRILFENVFSIAGITMQNSAEERLWKDASLEHRFKIRSSLNGENFKIEKGLFAFNDLKVTMNGGVKDSLISFKVRSNITSLKQIIKQVPRAFAPDIAALKTDGKISFGVDVSGHLRDSMPKVRGHFRFKDGQIKHPELPEAITGIDIDAEFREDLFALRTCRASLGGMPVDVKIERQFKQDTTRIDGAVLCDIDLEKLGRVVRYARERAFKGHLLADFSLSGYETKEVDSVRYSGTVSIKDYESLRKGVVIAANQV